MEEGIEPISELQGWKRVLCSTLPHAGMRLFTPQEGDHMQFLSPS